MQEHKISARYKGMHDKMLKGELEKVCETVERSVVCSGATITLDKEIGEVLSRRGIESREE